MIRILFTISILYLVSGCDSNDAPDCLKSRGETINKVYELESFSELEVNEDFNVIIKQGGQQEVNLITGENLVEDINLEVTSGVLVLTDNNSCRWVRDLDFPTVEITHPYLKSIRQNGGGKISSQGNLSYTELFLISEDSSGDIEMRLTCDKLSISSNELSNFYINGTVNELFVGFYSGDSRFEAENLVSTNAQIIHKGSNDIIVNVSNRLSGQVGATGDLIYVGQAPEQIDIELTNRGNLINGTGD